MPISFARGKLPGTVSATAAANLEPIRLAKPARALASCTTIGTSPRAARYAGIETYPPNPTTTSACKSVSKLRVCEIAERKRIGNVTSSPLSFRGNGTAGINFNS